MELGGSPRETGARPRGIPGLCNHQFAYPIQFWSHSSRPSRPASPFARASRSSSFPTTPSFFVCLFLFLCSVPFPQTISFLSFESVSSSYFPFLLRAQQFLIHLIFILQFRIYTFFGSLLFMQKIIPFLDNE